MIITESQDVANRLYDVFVAFMHRQFGGPLSQRTPRTDTLEKIHSLMRSTGESEQLVYALMREYLSNAVNERRR